MQCITINNGDQCGYWLAIAARQTHTHTHTHTNTHTHKCEVSQYLLRSLTGDDDKNIAARDRPKFGFGFGAEINNLNCFGTFRFRPNIDL